MTVTDADSLRATLAALPKIDLHRHLEGSVRLSTLLEIAEAYKIDLPAHDAEGLRPYVQVMPNSPLDSFHFLSKFTLLRQFYRAPQVIQRVTREAVEDAAADNIKYIELRFTPKALAKHMNYTFEDVTRWVADAVDEAQKAFDIKVRLIVSMNRHESVEEGAHALQIATDFRDRGVVALDLAGQESVYPASPFFGLFAEAHKEKLGVTVHAGEWAGPQNVRDAIEMMGATRIGHGVRILEDHATTQLARESGVTFEVCITSNIQSGVIRNVEHHPLRDMGYLNLKTTLNTDDPSVSNITLTDEMFTAVTRLGMTIDQIKHTILNAAESAFLPHDERAQLVTEFSEALALNRQSADGTKSTPL